MFREYEIVKSALDVYRELVNGQAQYRRHYVCPLHNERNASFYIYPPNKKYHNSKDNAYCFGCNRYLDAVNLYQALTDCDQQTAIAYCCRRKDGRTERIRLTKLAQAPARVIAGQVSEHYLTADELAQLKHIKALIAALLQVRCELDALDRSVSDWRRATVDKRSELDALLEQERILLDELVYRYHIPLSEIDRLTDVGVLMDARRK